MICRVIENSEWNPCSILLIIIIIITIEFITRRTQPLASSQISLCIFYFIDQSTSLQRQIKQIYNLAHSQNDNYK